MNLEMYILENYPMIFELLGLLIMLAVSAHISERMKKLTVIVVALLFVESILFYVELWTQTFEKMSLWRPFLTSCKYSIYPLILLFVMQIIVSDKPSKKMLFLLILPEIICIPLFFTSQWTHLVCYFTEENTFTGGPLRYLPYILFGGYGLIFLAYNIYYFRKNARIYILIISFITLGPFLGVYIYMYHSTDNVYSALFTSSLLLYYIFIYIHMAKTDTLTSLFNRQSYYHDIKTEYKVITAVISADMNGLKTINDNHGHEAGDIALKSIAGVLRDNCGDKGTVYRIGGDEFMILYKNTEEDEIKKCVETMRERMSETPYSCAFGYAIHKPLDNIKYTLNEADRKMYEDKAAIKATLHSV